MTRRDILKWLIVTAGLGIVAGLAVAKPATALAREASRRMRQAPDDILARIRQRTRTLRSGALDVGEHLAG